MKGMSKKFQTWIYEKVLKGALGSETVYKLSNSYLTKQQAKDKAIDNLIR